MENATSISTQVGKQQQKGDNDNRVDMYMLEKIPNLLCFNLFIPVIDGGNQLDSSSSNKSNSTATATSTDSNSSSSNNKSSSSSNAVSKETSNENVDNDLLRAERYLKKSKEIEQMKQKNKTSNSNSTSNNASKLVPIMTLNKRKPYPLLRIFTPIQNEQGSVKFKPFIDIPLDCEVDLDRSKLRLEGKTDFYIKQDRNYLVARLSFSQYHEAYSSRTERLLNYPTQAELDPVEYNVHGIMCNNCGNRIVKENKIKSIHHAPFVPWYELLECFTCVPAEQYLGGKGDPAFGVTRVLSKPGSSLTAEATISICIQDVEADSFEKCKEFKNPFVLSLCSYENDEAGDLWYPIQCSKCKNSIGDLRKVNNTTQNTHACSGHDHCEHKPSDASSASQQSILDEVRLYKFALNCGSLFDKMYSIESVIGGHILRASSVRECYRFVLASPNAASEEGNWENIEPHCKIILLSKDILIQTMHDVPPNPNTKYTKPAMKILFETYQDIEAKMEQEEAHQNNKDDKQISKSDRKRFAKETMIQWAQDEHAEFILYKKDLCLEFIDLFYKRAYFRDPTTSLKVSYIKF